MRRWFQRRWVRGGLVVCLAGASLGLTRAAKADGAVDPKDLTDEQVVASMKKGIDFLLAAKQNDNWETGSIAIVDNTWPCWKGGRTALVLYALLHAGDSLQDDPDYHEKLHWRGKELAPSIDWLSKVTPIGTYAASLEASALTLVPKLKDQKPGEGGGPQAALDACKLYFMRAMGHDGGYTYSFDPEFKPYADFEELWDAYAKAVKANDSGQAKLKTSVDWYLSKTLVRSYISEQMELQNLVTRLQARKRAAKSAADTAEAEFSLRLLENYSRTMPRQAAPDESSYAKDAVANYKAALANQKAGHIPDPKNPKQMIAATPAQLQEAVDSTKHIMDVYVERAEKHFTPLGDLSNGQYGPLGAWALVDYGMEMPNSYWTVSDHFWRMMQNADGGWPYQTPAVNYAPDKVSTDSMTAAGVASLFICQEFTDNELRLIPKPDKNIDAGLAWLVKNYQPTNKRYFMYGVERVGLASGLKFFGTTDWYKSGAAALIGQQAANGSWSGEWSDTIDTAYALLFLARGRNPVVFNKLEYNGYWNARPRDGAYVTRWMSKRFERPINWQVVNLQVSPEEWLDAPILLITGSVDPKFTPDDLAKLRSYVNAGGMIFSTSDGNTQAFTAAMKKYAEELVDHKYEMRTLPKNHELFSKELNVDLPNPPALLGLSNGSRELWIHSPQDVGADWQMRKFTSKNFELASALYFYASGMATLRSKLQPLAVKESNGPAAHSIHMARLDYSGNSDPEPGAWPRMAKLAKADFKTDVELQTVKFADLDAKKTPLAHLTGTTHVTFTDEDAKALKAYLDGGGLLFVDAAGGNTDFADSCRELVKKIYPAGTLAPLPADHPIYTGKMPDGAKAAEVEFRKYGNLHLQRRVSAPELQGVTVDGHLRIIFSPFDICSGFLGTNTWGITGYAPASAVALGRNIILYAMNP